MTAQNAPMSAEDVLAKYEYQLRGRGGPFTAYEGERYLEYDFAKAIVRDIIENTVCPAMAEREAALVARVAELEESFTRAGLNAREAQTKAHEATIALTTARAKIARLELLQVPALVKEVEALRAAIRNYKLEYENPAKDYVLRSQRREQLFAALDAGPRGGPPPSVSRGA